MFHIAVSASHCNMISHVRCKTGVHMPQGLGHSQSVSYRPLQPTSLLTNRHATHLQAMNARGSLLGASWVSLTLKEKVPILPLCVVVSKCDSWKSCSILQPKTTIGESHRGQQSGQPEEMRICMALPLAL